MMYRLIEGFPALAEIMAVDNTGYIREVIVKLKNESKAWRIRV